MYPYFILFVSVKVLIVSFILLLGNHTGRTQSVNMRLRYRAQLMKLFQTGGIRIKCFHPFIELLGTHQIFPTTSLTKQFPSPFVQHKFHKIRITQLSLSDLNRIVCTMRIIYSSLNGIKLRAFTSPSCHAARSRTLFT